MLRLLYYKCTWVELWKWINNPNLFLKSKDFEGKRYLIAICFYKETLIVGLTKITKYSRKILVLLNWNIWKGDIEWFDRLLFFYCCGIFSERCGFHSNRVYFTKTSTRNNSKINCLIQRISIPLWAHTYSHQPHQTIPNLIIDADCLFWHFQLIFRSKVKHVRNALRAHANILPTNTNANGLRFLQFNSLHLRSIDSKKKFSNFNVHFDQLNTENVKMKKLLIHKTDF